MVGSFVRMCDRAGRGRVKPGAKHGGTRHDHGSRGPWLALPQRDKAGKFWHNSCADLLRVAVGVVALVPWALTDRVRLYRHVASM